MRVCRVQILFINNARSFFFFFFSRWYNLSNLLSVCRHYLVIYIQNLNCSCSQLYSNILAINLKVFFCVTFSKRYMGGLKVVFDKKKLSKFKLYMIIMQITWTNFYSFEFYFFVILSHWKYVDVIIPAFKRCTHCAKCDKNIELLAFVRKFFQNSVSMRGV